MCESTYTSVPFVSTSYTHAAEYPTRISEEYGDTKPDNFDEIFERFIQNTSKILIGIDLLQLMNLSYKIF